MSLLQCDSPDTGNAVVGVDVEEGVSPILPTTELEKTQSNLFSYPWIRDKELWIEYVKYREFSNPSIFLVFFTGAYIPYVVLRTYIYGVASYGSNVYWSLTFAFVVLISFPVYAHMGLLVLKPLEQRGEMGPLLRLFHKSCLGLKWAIENSCYLSLPDLIVILGVLVTGFGLLGRVHFGPCPPEVNLFTSQSCNPDAGSNSLPIDAVVALYLPPLAVMNFVPVTSIHAVALAYLLSMTFGTIALVWVGGFLQSFSVCLYGPVYLVCSIEIERMWRVAFFERINKVNILKQLFPAHIVPKLIKGEAIEQTNHDDVCIFFSDICQFTELTHILGPSGTKSIINDVMLVMDDCTKRCAGVWKVERVGDSYVCESGVVYSRDSSSSRLQENCVNILSFALMVRSKVSKIINPATGSPLQLRIGVHCGPCAAGLVGNQKMMPHFSLFGDVINCTSRLETSSTPNMIHVSEDVVRALRMGDKWSSMFSFSSRGVVDLKGLGKMTTYWLLGSSSSPPRQEPETRSPQTHALYNEAMLDFQFDVRSVPDEVEPLTDVLFGILSHLFDFNRIGVNPVTLKTFIRTVGESYKRVPYHNFHHAFCVAQFTATLYHRCILQVLTVKRSLEMTMFASMIAVICHDVGHDGFNNSFHVNSNSPLAKTFFNQSPLENMHISVTNTILGMHSCNVFENWDFSFSEFARNLISNSLLATDMKLHDDVLADLALYDPLLLESSATNFDPDPDAVEMLSFNVEQYELLRLSRLMLHAADISNSVRPFSVSATFVDKLVREFTRQVEHEREQGLPVADFMVIPDVTKKAKGELYFLKSVSRPYFVALAKCFTGCVCLVDMLDDNVAGWEEVLSRKS